MLIILSLYNLFIYMYINNIIYIYVYFFLYLFFIYNIVYCLLLKQKPLLDNYHNMFVPFLLSYHLHLS